MDIIDSLNTIQREAVLSDAKNLLVLAGAGSGKTRVLAHRIAWLIKQKQISPYAILAVTFTNKAANEMRARIESLNGEVISGMWVGTFHGIAHRLLRAHWQAAELQENFQIIDAEDQYRIIRRIMKNLNIDEDRWPPKQAQWYISHQKDEGKRPLQLSPQKSNSFEYTMACIYGAYENFCRQSSLVDFSELLLRAYELWQKQPAILQHYQQRFQHILVDEFQDTNTLQYAWLQLLTHQDNNVMIVGDDDQSIYGWRGAKIENILRFQQDFQNTQLFRLEQNYRSTGHILEAANVLITHNSERLGKNLWTESGDGEPISVYTAYNDRDEAYYIVNQIIKHAEHGHSLSEHAILYRSNAQSRVLEETLIQKSIPYRVYGGMRFFERAEIKDALAYLNLLLNVHNDAAFERVVNFPTRGLGDRTLDIIRQFARAEQVSMWVASSSLIQQGKSMSGRAANAIMSFINLIEQLKEEVKSLPLHEQTSHVLYRSDLLTHYKKEKGEKGQMRVENLEELISAAKQFETEQEDNNITPLASFLAQAALEAGETQAGEQADCVQLMTLHSAKGLEFPFVFLAGLEDGLFPHIMSLGEGNLEEERRLCYVGMTRAMQKLYLTHAEVRRLHGKETIQKPSRFLREMPENCLEEVRKKVKISRPTYFHTSPTKTFSATPSPSSGAHPFRLGQTVFHDTFGEGVILDVEGSGPKARIQIKFKKAGIKRLMLEKANLTTI